MPGEGSEGWNLPEEVTFELRFVGGEEGAIGMWWGVGGGASQQRAHPVQRPCGG